MPQKRIEFLKQIELQLLKYGGYSLTDEESVVTIQSIYNESVDAGDTIVDADMPTTQPGVALDWSAGAANDLIVNFSKGDYYVEQDLGQPNVVVSQIGPATWETVGIEFAFALGNSWTIKLFNDDPYVVYSSYGSSVDDNTYVEMWDGSSWNILGGTESFLGDVNPLKPVGMSYNSSNGILVMIEQYFDPNIDVSVKKWDGSSWIDFGSILFSYDGSFKPHTNFSLYASSGTEVYAAYCDQTATTIGDVSVKEWNGSSWVFLGSQGINSIASDITVIKLDSSGLPILLYNDASTGQVEVKKWDSSSSWDSVATTGLTNVDTADMAVDSSNNIYICYVEDISPYNIGVIKWDGSSWSQVGGYVGQTVSYSSEVDFIKLDSDENPNVVFVNSSEDNKTYVKKWNGSSWENVGDTGRADNTTSETYKPTIEFGNNSLYVLYADFSGGNNGTVRKY